MGKYSWLVCAVLILGAAMLPRMADTQSKDEKEAEENLPGMKENEPLELEMWGGIRDLYKIAVPEPLGHSDVGSEVQQIQSNDFKLSSLFEVLPPKSYLADLAAEGMSLDKDP